MSDVADRVKKIVVEHLGVDEGKVTENASFIDDLGADNVWRRLLNGESGIGAIQSFDVSDLPAKIAGQVPRGDTADGHFNVDDWVPPKDQRKMDTFILFAMGAAVQAIEDSGWQPED